MSETKVVLPPVPDRLWKLLELALKDYDVLSREPNYKIDMSTWYAEGLPEKPGDKVPCTVCLAGCAIAGTLLPAMAGTVACNRLFEEAVSAAGGLTPVAFSRSGMAFGINNQEGYNWASALHALNYVRRGELLHAWSTHLDSIPLSVSHACSYPTELPEQVCDKIPAHHHFPAQWRRAMDTEVLSRLKQYDL